MGAHDDYLAGQDRLDIEREERRKADANRNRGGGGSNGGCVVALLVLTGGLISVSYGVYQFFC